MAIREALLDYLGADAGVTALVSGRIYWKRRPQGSGLPAIVCARITGGYGHTLDSGSGHAQPIIQISAVGETNASAEAVAEAIRDCMQGAAGLWGDTRVTSVLLRNEIDLDQPDQLGGDVGTHEIALDYEIQHAVSVPSP
jgi:hypothetical protein